MQNLEQLLRNAREISWSVFGKRIRFYLPGMFCCNDVSGRYPAVSITGSQCLQDCEHCKGTLLRNMLPAETPQSLIERGLALAKAGNRGMLVSGGCNPQGNLPWDAFFPALRFLKDRTSLHISVHSGFINADTARGFKEAGLDEVLLDVVGSDETYRQVFHVSDGLARLRQTIDALVSADLSVVPHLVCGLHFGRIKGEEAALEMLISLRPRLLVTLSLMGLPGTPMQNTAPPPEDVIRILCLARLRLPQTEISLGCARPRGGRLLETLAVDAGVNRMVLPSEEALRRAKYYGLAVEYRKTCCSVGDSPTDAPWMNDDMTNDDIMMEACL
ncbi:MAG: hypothetical protein LBC94_02435 [Desulfovibrio sp.]|jgi:uncharacterized radical SAM superfamily protein|nr:hypothetical protein [Desulfovibrio sp.]